MASFDVIDAVGFGYKFVWLERRYLMRLAAAAIALKMVGAMIVTMLGFQDSIIRQSFILLPSYFAEGWMLSHLVRLVLYGQKWPFRPSGDIENDRQILAQRAQGVLTGTVMYACIRFLMCGVLEVFFTYSGAGSMQAGVGQSLPEPSGSAMIGALMFVLVMVWAFRFVWLFIPAAANAAVDGFLTALKGYGSSLYMIGAWLVSTVPLLFLSTLLISVFVGGGADPAAKQTVASFFWVFSDVISLMIATASITYGYRGLLSASSGGRKGGEGMHKP